MGSCTIRGCRGLTQVENPWLAIAGKYADAPNWEDYQAAIAEARQEATAADGICLDEEQVVER